MRTPSVRLITPATSAVRDRPRFGMKTKPARTVPATAPAVFTA